MNENWDNWDGDKKRVLEALDECYGIVSKAAANAKVGRSTIYRWLESDKEFKAAVEEIRDAAVDHVESQLFNLINNGDTGSTIFFMKTRAKNRGYVERTEITGAGGNPLAITWNEQKTYETKD